MQINEENIQLLAELTEDGKPHRTEELYAAFQEKSGMSIPRKEFLMFLRAQVIKDEGILKRKKFGVYQKRTDPQDRGVLLPKKRLSALNSGTREGPASLEELLDTACGLMEQITVTLRAMGRQRGLPPQALRELNAIRGSTLYRLDEAVSGIAAAMAWQEDHDPHASREQPGGLSIPKKEETERMSIHSPHRSRRGGDAR